MVIFIAQGSGKGARKKRIKRRIASQKPVDPKIYLRRLITFEKKLLQKIKKPTDRKIAINAMSLLNTTYFYDYNPQVTVAQYMGFIRGQGKFWHSKALLDKLVGWGGSKKEILEWVKNCYEEPALAEKRRLMEKDPKDTITVVAENFRRAIEPVFNKILKENGIYEEYNTKLEQAKRLLEELQKHKPESK